jgi:hypothetical protein
MHDRMPALESVQCDTTGFSAIAAPEGALGWRTADGDGIGLFFFGRPPDIGAAVSDIDGVRRSCRGRVYGAGLGIIEIEGASVDGCCALRTIYKQPQVPHGMTYIASLTFPFRDFSYVLKAQCREQGNTGVRDSAVLAELLAKGLVRPVRSDGEMFHLSGWMRDPYDPEIDAPLMRNASESEAYDSRFPEHPLSRARRLLRHLEATTVLAPDVRSAAAFVGPQILATTRPWWQLWR